MLRKILYPKFESAINRIVAWLTQQGISPNQLTLTGAALNLLAGVIYAKGFFFLGGWMLLVAGLGDLLDGPLARATGKASSFGAFLDSTVDRYSDFFVFAGIAACFIGRGEVFWFLVSLGIILGAFAVSYSKARAENFIKDCGVGVFGRGERVILLGLASIFTPLLKLALLVLLVGTHITAVQRILHTKKTLTGKSSAKG
ncbi:MAG TPA: CDP-alcohol phosphatidyltransferase family protein [Candidatus Omnitrophota bacterium]|nr:CDP-alcohol phosphatidyltransferase family protein [Candidatus Omnitrophota bacterium]HPS36632.1 CDP-alcohol phosphatidyltransferase family protein [Candidatus Omnitrophota bacterium]